MSVISEERKLVLNGLADRLAVAWKAKGVIGAVAETEAPANRDESYYTQDRMAAVLGLPVTGWKIGATTPVAREAGGHSDIIPGRLFPEITHFGMKLTLDLGECPNPRVETEFGFRLNADMPLRDAPWRAEDVAPIVTLYPALEIIGTRFEMPGASNETLSLMGVADNGVCVAGIFGDALEDTANVDFSTHLVTLTVDGGPASENLLGEARADPRQSVANLANLLAKRGLFLKKDDMLLSGMVTVPQAVKKGSTMVADYGSMGRFEVSFT